MRAVAPDAAIYVLNGLLPGTARLFAEHNLRPVIGSSRRTRRMGRVRAPSATGAAAPRCMSTPA